MKDKNGRPIPFKATHPGEILGEELRERGIKLEEFAKLINIEPSHLDELIKGKRDINEDIAKQLELQLGIPYRIWMNLQNSYISDLQEIKKKNKKKILRRIWIIAAVVLLAIDLYVGLYEIYLYGVCSGKYFWDIDIFNLQPYKAATAIQRGYGALMLMLLDSIIILLNAVFICVTPLLRKSNRQ